MNTSADLTQLQPVKRHSTAVVLHLFYTELFDELRSYLEHLQGEFDLYLPLPDSQAEFENNIRQHYPEAVILLVPNRGRQLAPFVELLKLILPLTY